MGCNKQAVIDCLKSKGLFNFLALAHKGDFKKLSLNLDAAKCLEIRIAKDSIPVEKLENIRQYLKDNGKTYILPCWVLSYLQ